MELTVGGRRVRAATGGAAPDPADPLVLFLHGAGADHTMWAHHAGFLAARNHAVLAVDLPGHGGSEGPPAGSVHEAAGWTADVVATAGWDEAVLVGHSMGALIALETAAAHPDRVHGMAVIAGAAAMPVNPELLAASADDPPRAWRMVMNWGLPRTAGLEIPLAAPEALHADFAMVDRYTGGEEAAPRVRCPVLLVHGTRDRMVPVDAARRLGAALSDARLVALDGVGHFPVAERPGAVRDALDGFLG